MKTKILIFLLFATSLSYAQRTKVHFLSIDVPFEYILRTTFDPEKPIKFVSLDYYILDIPADSLGVMRGKKNKDDIVWLKFDKKQHYFIIKSGLMKLTNIEVTETTENTIKMYLRTYPIISPIEVKY